ncbi:MAG: hypothetical protein CM1200mP28_17260 [Deltaproteobacteria bacterium]|nr:MAG: hypothetical protein CM1200mP28_17260 [Deltaproteobacteria bacterium]
MAAYLQHCQGLGNHSHYFIADLYRRLYFLQNVFQQTFKQESQYQLSSGVLEQFRKAGINTYELDALTGSFFLNPSAEVKRAVKEVVPLSSQQGFKVVEYSLQNSLVINPEKLSAIDNNFLSTQQLEPLETT